MYFHAANGPFLQYYVGRLRKRFAVASTSGVKADDGKSAVIPPTEMQFCVFRLKSLHDVYRKNSFKFLFYNMD